MNRSHGGYESPAVPRDQMRPPPKSACKPADKDPWCCATDKLRINLSGFDTGWLNAMRTIRSLVRALDKDEALAVINELINEYQPAGTTLEEKQ